MENCAQDGAEKKIHKMKLIYAICRRAVLTVIFNTATTTTKELSLWNDPIPCLAGFFLLLSTTRAREKRNYPVWMLLKRLEVIHKHWLRYLAMILRNLQWNLSFSRIFFNDKSMLKSYFHSLITFSVIGEAFKPP